uniref:Variant surface glycoprotein 1125.1234 n=1 Tax=Trypanosoma brucei TaxID=5691 RepID=A0A1J0R6M7_9TRYP|nr:variant surface glycoprotein 1125.1234 [Trypanosoma brucei]
MNAAAVSMAAMLIVANLLNIGHNTAEAAVANPLKKTYWEAMCDLSNDGNLLAQRAASRLKQPAATAQEDTKTLLRALVFLENGNETLKGEAVKTAADYSARELQESLNFYTGAGAAREVQAARDGGRLQGALREFLATQAVVSASNNGCLSAGAGATTVVQGIQQLETTKTTCKLETDLSPEGWPNFAVSAKAGPQGELAEIKTVNTITANGQNTNCDLNSINTGYKWLNDGSNNQNIAANNPSVAAELISISSTGLTSKELTTLLAADGALIIKAAEAAIKREQATAQPADEATATSTGSNDNFKQAARRYLLGLVADENKQDQQLQSKVTEAYNAAGKPTKLLLQEIYDMPIEGIIKNSSSLKKLGDVTDINQLLELHFYYSDLKKKKLANAEKKLQETGAKEGTKSAKKRRKNAIPKARISKKSVKNWRVKGVFLTKTAKMVKSAH